MREDVEGRAGGGETAAAVEGAAGIAARPMRISSHRLLMTATGHLRTGSVKTPARSEVKGSVYRVGFESEEGSMVIRGDRRGDLSWFDFFSRFLFTGVPIWAVRLGQLAVLKSESEPSDLAGGAESAHNNKAGRITRESLSLAHAPFASASLRT